MSHRRHLKWMWTYVRATEPLKRKTDTRGNITRSMSRLVTGELGLKLGAKTIFFLPSTPLRKKKRGRVSGIWFVKIPVTVDRGQTPTKVYTF